MLVMPQGMPRGDGSTMHVPPTPFNGLPQAMPARYGVPQQFTRRSKYVLGGALLAVGFLAGRLGRRQAAPPPATTPLCGCGHTLSQHDTETSTCYAELRRDTFDKRGRWAGHSWVPCTCRQYIGPRPIDEVFLPRLLPPTGD